MATEITSGVLKEVRMLAEQVGVGAEGLGLLVANNEAGADGQEALALLGSAGEGALELLLSKWLDDESAETLRRAGTTPLILGPDPEGIPGKSSLLRWPVLKTEKLVKSNVRGHVVALQATGAISNRLEGELTGFGCWSTAIVVSRASQPFTQRERDFLRSLSRIVPAVAILLVAVPGELQGSNDMAAVMEYTHAQAENSGFTGSRFAGIWFWWIDGALHGSTSAVANPSEIISRQDLTNGQSRDLLVRSAVIRLLQQVKQKADTSGVKPLPHVDEHELVKICDDLLLRLERVKELCEDHFRQTVAVTDDQIRAFVKNEILGWGSSKNTFARPWLEYVDTIRPGTKAGLFRQMETAVGALSAKPASAHDLESSPSLTLLNRLQLLVMHDGPALQLINMAFAILVGLGLWSAATIQQYPGMLCALAAAIGTVIGFTLAKPLLAYICKRLGSQDPRNTLEIGPQRVSPSTGRVDNFNIFAQQLRDWLQQHIATDKPQVAERCDDLLRTL
jgi:hypothetical protein